MRQSQSLSTAGHHTVARGPRLAEGLPRRAQAYLLALGAVVTYVGAAALIHGHPTAGDLVTFTILAGAAAVAQFFLVGGARTTGCTQRSPSSSRA